MSGCKGLFPKYVVKRVDTGDDVDGCFVLRPVTDSSAWLAAMFYSYLTHNPRLARELREWLLNIKHMETTNDLTDLKNEEENNGSKVNGD